MISTGRTTKTWGTNQAQGFKPDNVHYGAASPEDPKAPAGNQRGTSGTGASGGQEAIGDLLNRIADPTGADAAKKAQRKPGNTLDKDDFLKLMLAQMKNQDPMNPMQNHEMAAQLAQFTSLEQLFNVNKNLDALKKQADPSVKFQALNFLGKSIKADSRQVFKEDGAVNSDLKFELLGDSSKVKIKVSDEIGTEIRTMELPNLKKGVQTVVWNGLDQDERPSKAGRYFVSIEAEGTNGKKLGVQTETHGVITGVNYTHDGPMLLVGDQRVRLQDVQLIEDEHLKQAQGGTSEGSTTPSPSSGPDAVAAMAGQQVNGKYVPPMAPRPGTSSSSGEAGPLQMQKVNKAAEQKVTNSHYNPRAALPLEVDGGGIKTDGPFKEVAKGG